MPSKRILILITKKTSPDDKSWDFFRRSLVSFLPSHTEVTMGELSELTFEIDNEGDKVYDRRRGFSLDDFQLVVFRLSSRSTVRTHASACASFLQARGIPYRDSQVQPGYWSKYSAGVQRYHAGFAPIPSVFSTQEEMVYMIENNKLPFSYPIVIKDINGKKGRLNFIAHSQQEARNVLRRHSETWFIVQKFIANTGDYRFLVIGNEVRLIIHRQAADSHLNNTSQGAAATVVDQSSFDKKVVQDVLLAAKIEALEVAGVDVMFDKFTGKHYIIEVNASPQLATGAVPELKMKAYADYLSSLL